MSNRRLIIVGGKGGVGRTTLSVALGMALSRRGKRVLLAHARCRHDLTHLLGAECVDEHIRLVGDNIWAVNMDPQAAIWEVGLLVLRFRALNKLVLQNRLIRSFIRAIPALEAYSMIGKAWFHTTEVLENGEPRFDTVIFDGPATGHMVSTLRIPQIISDVVPTGPLSTDARKARELLSDSAQTAMWIVTLAEEMVVNETRDFYRCASEELNIFVEKIVANALYPRDSALGEDERNQLRSLRSECSPDLREAVDMALFHSERYALHRRYLSMLADMVPPNRIVELPYVFSKRLDLEALEPLIAIIASAIERGGK